VPASLLAKLAASLADEKEAASACDERASLAPARAADLAAL